MTKLCVSLTREDTDAVLGAMHSLPEQVELVEVRLDAMASCDLEALLSGRDRPVIVTDRSAEHGGESPEPTRRRLGRLRRAAELGAEYLDVDLREVSELGEVPGSTRVIVSHHDFEETPPDLERILRRILCLKPDVAKIAVRARDIADVPAVLELLRGYGGSVPLIALSMGEAGLVSRVLAGKFGAFLTFASFAPGEEAAPGQVPCRDMLELYHFDRMGRETDVYGVVANPVAHSMSPAVHNAAFEAAGLDAVYLRFKVTDPEVFLRDFEPYDLRGLSVTIPHKEPMLRLMDETDELARRVGAVNTVRIDSAGRYGCNTDVAAATASVERAARRAGLLPLSTATVLLVGAGGGARAIAYGLCEKVGRLIIANRTVERAQELAGELGVEHCGLDRMTEYTPDIIINGTSVGMWPEVDRSPVPAEMLRDGMVVFDAVYNPSRTRLLEEAERAGAETASGVEWFVGQAAAQFELWTGRPAPREAMRAALTAGLKVDTGGESD